MVDNGGATHTSQASCCYTVYLAVFVVASVNSLTSCMRTYILPLSTQHFFSVDFLRLGFFCRSYGVWPSVSWLCCCAVFFCSFLHIGRIDVSSFVYLCMRVCFCNSTYQIHCSYWFRTSTVAATNNNPTQCLSTADCLSDGSEQVVHLSLPQQASQFVVVCLSLCTHPFSSLHTRRAFAVAVEEKVRFSFLCALPA